jgi:hypothetical protein
MAYLFSAPPRPASWQSRAHNINNGERFSTYVIRAAANSGEIPLNGAAARKAMIGDLLIITAYASYSEIVRSAYVSHVALEWHARHRLAAACKLSLESRSEGLAADSKAGFLNLPRQSPAPISDGERRA